MRRCNRVETRCPTGWTRWRVGFAPGFVFAACAPEHPLQGAVLSIRWQVQGAENRAWHLQGPLAVDYRSSCLTVHSSQSSFISPGWMCSEEGGFTEMDFLLPTHLDKLLIFITVPKQHLHVNRISIEQGALIVFFRFPNNPVSKDTCLLIQEIKKITQRIQNVRSIIRTWSLVQGSRFTNHYRSASFLPLLGNAFVGPCPGSTPNVSIWFWDGFHLRQPLLLQQLWAGVPFQGCGSDDWEVHVTTAAALFLGLLTHQTGHVTVNQHLENMKELVNLWVINDPSQPHYFQWTARESDSDQIYIQVDNFLKCFYVLGPNIEPERVILQLTLFQQPARRRRESPPCQALHQGCSAELSPGNKGLWAARN